MINNSYYLEAGGISSCIQNSDRQAQDYIGRRTIKQSISLTSESIAPASLNQQLITPSLVQHLLVTAYPVQELNIQIRTHYPVQELNIQIRSHSSTLTQIDRPKRTLHRQENHPHYKRSRSLTHPHTDERYI